VFLEVGTSGDWTSVQSKRVKARLVGTEKPILLFTRVKVGKYLLDAFQIHHSG